MMHKEKQGLFPSGEGQEDPVQTTTAPQNLGISLLQASLENRSTEVVLNPPSKKPQEPEQVPINYKNLDWAFREFIKI